MNGVVWTQRGYPPGDVERCLLLDGRLRYRAAIPAVFALLDVFDVVAPLRPYDVLAGVEPEPRLPLFDSRAVFLRRNPETEQFMTLWNRAGDLAFLNALWEIKPKIMPLPAGWVV